MHQKREMSTTEKGKSRFRLLPGAISVLLLAAIIGVTAAFLMNRIVVIAHQDRHITETQALSLKDVDCILVLGAGVYANKHPSAMLQDRLDAGISLYKLGVSDRLLMTGDNGRVDYNEVKVMKDYAVKAGVPPEHIFQDHAGFSTYESMYRARDVFAAKKIVVITQNYHMYRAIYIAQSLGLDAYGVSADPRAYAGQSMREFREILARSKDVISCVFKPLPTYLGDVIPVSGNGNTTN